MRYMLESEQILCMLRAEVVVEDGGVRFAGGHMLQVTPEGSGRDLERLLGNLETLDGLGEAMSSDDPDGRRWSQQMMQGFHWDQCARQQVAFECRCSRDRVLSMLSTLARSDLEELRDSAEPVSLTCEYCKTVYTVGPIDIGALLEPPS